MAEDNSENDPLKVSHAVLVSENERLKKDLGEALDAIQALKTEVGELKAYRESEVRGKLSEEIRQMGCTYGLEELDRMSLSELASLKEHYNYFNPPFKSGADFAPPVRKSVHDTLYELYTPLDKRMEK